ncbi:hypothetical protein F4780DRAFT_276980 [Xylariomycetidae sp. FL0641]|nr:hypothetical protein F4780DRAFT_276980 [Xylariomycetidae sp. FL0641]
MLRRPPGEGRPVAQPRKVLLALAVILLPWLQFVDAQQQRQHSSPEQAPLANILKDDDLPIDDYEEQHFPGFRHESPFGAHGAAGKLAATVAESRNKPRAALTRGHNNSPTSADESRGENHEYANIHLPDDASALATLAPAQPVRAPSSPRHLSSILAGAGLSSLQSARSLENWEVEDYILLATVDGHLYAVNRETGDERWHLQVEQPVVETIHHRPNRSFADDENEYERHPLDDYIWVVEPSHDGAVYAWSPTGFGTGLMNTGLSMKQLVNDWGNVASPDPPVAYTGHKKNTLITVDAATGRVLKWFGQTGSQVDQSATCLLPNGRLVDADSEECSDSGTITLSRTEYEVVIARRDGDGRKLATLRYAEWGPNSFDNDLHQQYRTTQDNRYFTSQHDGKIYALTHPTGMTSFTLQLSVPVARVFDVARPEDAPPGSNPDLVLLPQPIPPLRDEESALARSQSVLLNHTHTGSWYALSGWSYPLVVNAPDAPINKGHHWTKGGDQPLLDEGDFNEVLVGVHTLGSATTVPRKPSKFPPSLPSRPFSDSHEPEGIENHSTVPSPLPAASEYPAIVSKVIAAPVRIFDSTLDILTNPLTVPLLLFVLFNYRRELIRWIKRKWLGTKSSFDETPTFVQPTAPTHDVDLNVKDKVGGADSGDAGGAPATSAAAKTSEGAELPRPSGAELGLPEGETEGGQQGAEGELSEKKPQKKAHRGRRGGVKHRKGMKKQRENSELAPDKVSPVGEEEIPGLQNIGVPTKLEPNVTTLNYDPEDVSGPIVKIGGIEVNQDEQLGMGSNGTIVFAGKFHGRDVAVKRMLTQFWDIAAKETELLLESDHHPNVIRYFAMSKNDSFLYIALELCQASLSDIVDKPNMFQQLARAGEMDVPRVLLQIAHGLGFLHDLRIVHRDLKPQNILVTMGRDGKPRLLVSDFGLCKKLEGGQSSFGATTAHAAGTSGWRAPELLLDDDARDVAMTMASSTHSDSSSQLVSSDVMPNRRATRAIDIFSLGLVFYYVLTKGLHPFDCGDRYMREVNIRKGQFNLQPLDMLGDVAHEAKALIETMLRADPRARPSAKDVMSHPFFWSPKERLAFLCDVSDHFELEPRDPPSRALLELEGCAPQVCRADFLRVLPKEFVDSLGKQRKYTGTRLLDLLRALRNKRFHYGDMPTSLKRVVGPLPEGYLGFWTRRFPSLLIVCCTIIYKLNLEDMDTFREYFKPRIPL